MDDGRCPHEGRFGRTERYAPRGPCTRERPCIRERRCIRERSCTGEGPHRPDHGGRTRGTGVAGPAGRVAAGRRRAPRRPARDDLPGGRRTCLPRADRGQGRHRYRQEPGPARSDRHLGSAHGRGNRDQGPAGPVRRQGAPFRRRGTRPVVGGPQGTVQLRLSGTSGRCTTTALGRTAARGPGRPLRIPRGDRERRSRAGRPRR